MLTKAITRIILTDPLDIILFAYKLSLGYKNLGREYLCKVQIVEITREHFLLKKKKEEEEVKQKLLLKILQTNKNLPRCTSKS